MRRARRGAGRRRCGRSFHRCASDAACGRNAASGGIVRRVSAGAGLLYWWRRRGGGHAGDPARDTGAATATGRHARVGGCSDADLLARSPRTATRPRSSCSCGGTGRWCSGRVPARARPHRGRRGRVPGRVPGARPQGRVRCGAAPPSRRGCTASRCGSPARLARERARPRGLEAEPAARPAPDPPERDELRGVLDAEIDRLSEPCRRAFVLCYLEGLSTRRRPGGSGARRERSSRGWRSRKIHMALAARRHASRGHRRRRPLAPDVVARTARAAVAFAWRRGGCGERIVDPDGPEVLAMWQSRTWAAVAVLATVVFAATAAGLAWADPPVPPPTPESLAALDEPPKPRSEEARPATTKPDPKGEKWATVRNLGKADGVIYAVSPDGNEIAVRPKREGVFTLLNVRTGQVRRVEGEFGRAPRQPSRTRRTGSSWLCAEWQNGAPTIRDAKTVERHRPRLPERPALRSRRPRSRPTARGSSSTAGRGAAATNSRTPTKSIAHYDYQLVLWDVAKKKELGWPTARKSRPGQLNHVVQQLFPNRPFLMTRVEVPTPNGLGRVQDVPDDRRHDEQVHAAARPSTRTTTGSST